MKEVSVLYQDQKLYRILCDQRQLLTPPDDRTGFLTAVQFDTLPYAGIKLAIIRKSLDDKRLFEVAAKNRGIMVEIFVDEKVARQWLLGSQSHDDSTETAH
jgi:hypothetical protein